MYKLKLYLLFIWAFNYCPFTYAQQQQNDNDTDKVLSPYFFVKSDNPATDQLPLKNTSAHVEIAGMVANVIVTQVYKNEGKNTLEAIYTFPASTNAAVYAMEMKIGQRRIVAKIEEKQQARQQYEQAKKEGKRASLLEQERPNVFQMNVANILPGDEIHVQLSYTEILVPENGIYEFIYPTVVGPRYSNTKQTDENADSFVNSPYQKEGKDALYDFDIEVQLSAGMPIQDFSSKTHDIDVHYRGTDWAMASLKPSENKGGNRDFVLTYQLAGDKINSGLLLYEHEDENFFLLVIQPPKRVTKNDIPPREYIFINDVSGSMRGYPMDVSKKLMSKLVGNLRPEDRFNVMLFAGSSGWMAEESIEANEENINNAIAFIDKQQGGGGTEILPALQKALSFPRKYDELSRSFVIVTDGYVNVEKEAFDLIRNNNDKANTFAFGIGQSVNRFIIEGMAHVGMGEPFIVLDESQSEEKAEKFRQYIAQPVLTQVEKEFSGFKVADVEPITIPDVLAERPIIIYGKYEGKPTGSITLKGYTGKKKWKQKIDVSKVQADTRNAPLRYLWARKRIQLLDDYTNLSRDDKDKDEITALGLKYNLLTNYTSFIAIEEKPAGDGKMETVKQPLPMPAGVSNAAVGFSMRYAPQFFGSFSAPAPTTKMSSHVKPKPPKAESIRFYDKIFIASPMSGSDKKALSKQIESRWISSINYCFSNTEHGNKIKIDVIHGQVKKVSIEGANIDKVFEACIKNTIQYWTFGNEDNFSFYIVL